MFELFKKIKCEHDFEFVNKYTPNMIFPNLEKTKKYIFKCKKCNKIMNIDNYEVIDKIQNIFIKCLNEELNKNPNNRMGNRDFKNYVWSKYSDYPIVNKTLMNEINVQPIDFNFKELNSITEQDILNLKFKVNGAWTIYNVIDRELKGDFPYIIYKSKKGKYDTIRYYRFKNDIEDDVKNLNEKYLNKGVNKDDSELKIEAIENFCKSNKILYIK